jgi:hypothetical protein
LLSSLWPQVSGFLSSITKSKNQLKGLLQNNDQPSTALQQKGARGGGAGSTSGATAVVGGPVDAVASRGGAANPAAVLAGRMGKLREGIGGLGSRMRDGLNDGMISGLGSRMRDGLNEGFERVRDTLHEGVQVAGWVG